MTKSKKSKSILVILAISVSMLAPCLVVSNVSASEYAFEQATVQVRTLDGIWPMCTIQLYTQAETYSPYPGSWRVLDYWTGIFNEYHFQWVPVYWWIFIIDWETKYVYQVIDIDWYEYSVPGLGTIIAGSTWRFKLYERNNPSRYFIFDLQAYVVAGGGTDVQFTPVSSSSNGWTHIAEEIDWNEHVEGFLGEWLDNNPA